MTLRFRGRELAHQDLAMSLLERLRDEVGELAKIEQKWMSEAAGAPKLD